MHFGFSSPLMGKTFHTGLICQQAIHIMDQAINQFGTYEEFEEQTGGRILSRSQIISLVRKYLKKEDLESEIQVTLHIKMYCVYIYILKCILCVYIYTMCHCGVL